MKKFEKTLILGPVSDPKFFFRDFYLYKLDIVPSYHPIKFKGKLMNQFWENGKTPNFGPNFGPNLTPQNFFVSFISTRCQTLLQGIILCNFQKNEQTKLQKMVKNLILDPIVARLSNIYAPNHFCGCYLC